MNERYQKIIDLCISSGKRLKTKSGKISDIGVVKKYLTEEDIRIERDFAKLIKSFGLDHNIFAEEENNILIDSNNIWSLDPISGTGTFIEGLPHYTVAVSHLSEGKVKFAAVYDPSVDEMYVAVLGKGAYCNNKKINIKEKRSASRIILNLSSENKELEKKLFLGLVEKDYKVYRNRNSHALNYCLVASGKYDGVVSHSHDIFAELPGSLILSESGGCLLNNNNEKRINLDDRLFVGGSRSACKELSHFISSNK